MFSRFRRQGAAIGCGVLMLAAGARAELTITGVDKSVEAVLRAFVTIDELSCTSPRWWLKRAFERTPAEARQALETLGYYQASVEAQMSQDEACWQATLAIKPGDPTRFGAVDLTVAGPLADEPQMRELLAKRELRSGRRFTHERYESAKKRLLAVAEDLGYFDAQFARSQVRVDADANRADVELALEGGERYLIGEIEIEQQELNLELFRKFLSIRTGAPFDARDLATTYRDLLGSEYFDRVLVTPEVELREAGRVPVRVSASTTTRRTILLGAGYATDTGPRARADLRYRRLNDRGHRANLSTLVSGLEGTATAEYRVPHGDAAREWLFAQSEFSYEDTDAYVSRNWMAGVGRIHRRREVWTETNYANYQVDDYDIAGERGRSELVLLGTSWSRKTLTDEPRPLSGYAIDLDLRGAAEVLLSDTDVLQAIGHGKYILPLGSRVRMLSRASAGWTWQQKFDDLPPSIRFFAGGDNSVRGYDFESLGPEQAGQVVGGRHLLTGSVELDVLLREKWSAALFADAGSAYDDSPDFSRSVGVGLRWYSPLGPLRLDLAHPLDDPNRSVRIHISLGPDL